MNACLAIIAYRAIVNDVPTGSLDFQVRWFSVAEPEAVRRLIRAEHPHKYQNDRGELIRWELAAIMAVERFSPGSLNESGEELIGFIAQMDELVRLVEQRD